MKRVALFAAAVLTVAGVAYAWLTVGAVGPGLPLRLVGDYPLTGNTTRFDYASMDAARGTIWVAHMGDGSVEAFDVKANRVTLTVPISPAASVRGVLAARGNVYALDPGLHRLYAASESGIVSVYDVTGRRFHRIAQAFVHLNAHVVAVDPATHRVYFPLQNAGGRPVMRVMEPK